MAQLMLAQPDFGWRPQLDNPTFLGWSVVAFYGVAALACARAAVLARAGRVLGAQGGRPAGCAPVWWVLASALCFLGVNKQLNLQTLMIAIGRNLAAAGGWSHQRRAVQLVFSVVFGFGLWLALVWLAARHRDFFRQNPRVFWGVLILVVFVALRAATINHADSFLRLDLKDEHWAWVMEIGGSVLIGIGAAQSRQPSET
jgi:hypothetical protein